MINYGACYCLGCGLLYFPVNFNKLYPISVLNFSKIVDITYAMYQRTNFYKIIEYVERKDNNPPGVNLCQNFAFVCTTSFSP